MRRLSMYKYLAVVRTVMLYGNNPCLERRITLGCLLVPGVCTGVRHISLQHKAPSEWNNPSPLSAAEKLLESLILKLLPQTSTLRRYDLLLWLVLPTLICFLHGCWGC